MSFVWRTGAAGETHTSLPRRAELGPRIMITCQVILGMVYFVLVIRTFRNYGEVGRKARVVQRLADVQIELETRPEWARDHGRDDVRAREREAAEEGTREGERGRSRTGDGVERKANPQGNELGLSGVDRKEDATVARGGDLPTNDSYSSLGM